MWGCLKEEFLQLQMKSESQGFLNLRINMLPSPKESQLQVTQLPQTTRLWIFSLLQFPFCLVLPSVKAHSFFLGPFPPFSPVLEMPPLILVPHPTIQAHYLLYFLVDCKLFFREGVVGVCIFRP